MPAATGIQQAFTTKVGGSVESRVVTVNVNINGGAVPGDIDDATADKIAEALDRRRRKRNS